ncbi:hypothetical protein B0H11DRAFT_2368827 [Mycena galericulata]|nr:hypothetical protein B0H11DRAFT_2368827 [Mycena galericulata]
MPGRQVHFSSYDIFHSPPPWTSSDSSSSSSSSGPFTPPLYYAPLPGPTPFVPRRSRSYTDATASHGRAHNLLSFSPIPLINYDISLHPSTIYPCFPHGTLFESAIYPPRLAIWLVTPRLPWFIPVASSNGRFVTLSDILNSLYRTLRINITPAEFNALGTQKLMRSVSQTYARRYERLRGTRGYSEEKRQGVKRIDFLMGVHKFRGISPMPGASDVWQLNLS